MRRERSNPLRWSIKYTYISSPASFHNSRGRFCFGGRTFGELYATRRLWSTKPEFGLSLFSKNKVCPTFGVRPQLSEPFLKSAPASYFSPPTRTRSARVRCFSFFAFTSSPYDCKWLGNSDLRVKVSPLLPSPVKAKSGPFLHPQYTLYQRLAGEGEG